MNQESAANMKKRISLKLLMLIVGLMTVLYFVLTPKSVNTMKAEAYSEFESHLQDNKINKEQFRLSKILIKNNYLIFRWDACPTDSDTVSLYVQVPSYGYQSVIVSGLGDDKYWEKLRRQR
jgi:hypothetical protein